MVIERYGTTDFYGNLRNLPILQDSELNIEAAAFRNEYIFLFNRRKNLIISFVYKSLLNHIRSERAFPKPEISQFHLPEINGIEAGFTGATVLKGQPKIIVTASVEDTDNAYDDGEILGSFIGMIDTSSNKVANTFKFCLIQNTDDCLKVESVTIEEEISSGETKVIPVTDDDLGNSTILGGVLLW